MNTLERKDRKSISRKAFLAQDCAARPRCKIAIIADAISSRNLFCTEFAVRAQFSLTTVHFDVIGMLTLRLRTIVILKCD